ncbi:MAG TPA: PTS sugar transporter subunit IIA [Candidatus Enterocloster faecavium]|uniref:PTS sugar transporter subunit IIA n=1 Tax=Candidatus Enterocloster faecavium TaxID=2838560 RepID=A0A9D2RK89_9FIRM|nr:PTS sugar transporter subunit IIA [Candidatus Enterocloster faecavium]
MTRFFLASHGHLASGLASSIQILTGDSSRLRVFDAYVDERSLEEELEAFYENMEEGDQMILLSDMYGGSVNSIMYPFLTRPNTTLIAGVNLALVIGLLLGGEPLEPDTIKMVVEQSREAIRIVELEENPAEDEELF